MKFCSVESFTGGLFASKIVQRPGASKYFAGSIVAYSNQVKEKLGIDTSKGIINANVALEMAKKGKAFFEADLCFSFTGNAGPDAWDNKEVGLVYIGINDQVYEFKLKGSREQIQNQACDFALEKLDQLLEKQI
ncbi:COMPETENCE-DAMAGE PROTEIN [Mycoplasmopsis pulmonis]|uniref:COMPETENCE-DAMAGE PROTEIN n=1 Tax=Mycoplasmopsis pulmonis (strain UAB CTIP) TaxID=272635 RepID=Q98QN4_MYCPU|nr:CinA family protein [Mycoplasmopsis pulmonis]MDZ7293286.1 CinA family protein [Mycoplasmopsis pulmonis]CAC13500.1 COMPETENCE-DAMAGE PROTEIN [Mycoplasmopsis pulmonis]VEU68091.1 competence/damage-inducible protein CinA [Mycoplasmopsis pulmonis]